MGRTIGIISIKGGVGKTSLTTALGASLARDYNKKVLLVDANFSAPNLALHLGLIDPEVTIHHVLSDKVDIEKAIYESEQGFHLIPGSMVYGEINPFKLRSKLKSLRKYYDVILIDSSPTLNNEILASIIASDELYIVTTPDQVTLTTTLRAVNLAREKKTPIRGIIVNKVHNKNFELNLQEIEKISGCDVLAMLPHDTQILEALSKMDPLFPDRKIRFSREIRQLAGALVGEAHEKTVFEKVQDFFKLTPKEKTNRELLFQENSAELLKN